MRKVWRSTRWFAVGLSLACHEVDAPATHLNVPNSARLSQGPPSDVTYLMSSAALSYRELTGHNFPYDTWIVVQPNGPRFQLTAYPPAKPETQSVGATGAAGGRNGCDLNASVSFGSTTTGFGPCGEGAKYDTVLAKGQGFIRQGSMPLDFATVDNSDCPPHVSGTCHEQEIVDLSFTVSTIPVTIRPVKSVPRTVSFASVQYAQVAFTTGATPDTLLIGGVRRAMPITTTSWVYTAADGTLDGNMCNGGFPIVTCSPYLHKSGRMVVKAFVGGWEQTTSVTVQCKVSPDDAALNDSTSDFSVRSTMLAALDTSNVDSLPGAGYDFMKGRGWKHESGGPIFKMNDSTLKAFFLPSADSIGTECLYSPDLHPTLPAGAVRLTALYHTHVTDYNKPVFGCPDQNGQRMAQSPADTLPTANPRLPYALSRMGKNGGGSDKDWDAADSAGVPIYVVEKGGKVWRLDPGTAKNARSNNPNHWQALGGKCQWVK